MGSLEFQKLKAVTFGEGVRDRSRKNPPNSAFKYCPTYAVGYYNTPDLKIDERTPSRGFIPRSGSDSLS